MHTANPTGVIEDNIPVANSLGNGTITEDGLRIADFVNATTDTPTITGSTDYTATPFTGAISVSGTQEATVRWGVLKHDTTDYSNGYLPVGPDRSSDTGTQYFTFAFRRQVVANFDIDINSNGIPDECEPDCNGNGVPDSWDIKTALSDIRVPPLILQSLIENAVFHGVQPAIQGGSIYIVIYRCGDWLTIDLVNSLPEPTNNHAALSEITSGHQLALDNLRCRLDAFFSGGAELQETVFKNHYHTRILLKPLEG